MKHKKVILIVLIIIWMITVFIFSGQVGKKSKKASTGIIEIIVNKIYDTSNMSEKEKEDKIEDLQRPIRKLAHITIYTLGGAITLTFIDKFNITNKKKVIFSLMFCLIYAILDEIHQYYVPGRSCEIRDVLIDTIGALLGIVIAYKLINNKKKNRIET